MKTIVASLLPPILKYTTIIFLITSCGFKAEKKPFEEISTIPKILSFNNISTMEFHENANYLSSDNRTIFFTRSDKNFETSVLCYSKSVNGEWLQPETLPFSGTYYDAGFHFSPTEKEAFFTSKRNPNKPNLSPEWNIWRVNLDENNNWGEPEVLPPPINSSYSECCLTMNKNGLTFFSSNRDGSWDIYEAEYSNGQFSNVTKLNSAVNSEQGEWPGYINERGDMLLISSIRETGFGGDDIYVIKKVGNDWTKPMLLDSTINSYSYEDSPIISGNEEHLLFSSWKECEFSKGVSNIYCVSIPEF